MTARGAPRRRDGRWLRSRAPALLLLVALAGTLGGCGVDGPGAGRSPLDLDGSWHLVAGRDARGAFDLTGRTVTLTVDGRTAGGTSACNRYSATVGGGGETVTFGDVGGTEMGCDPDVMDLEQRYTAALQAIERAVREEDSLRLTGPDVVLDLDRDPPVVDAELLGTVWELESLIEGDSVASTVPGGEILLAGDGLLSGSSGCRSLQGRYDVEGASVTVSLLEAGPASGTCVPQAVAQHTHVVDVLTAGVTATVDGRSLTLVAPDGRGLQLRAP